MNYPQLNIQAALVPSSLFTDSRSYGYQGPTRNVHLYRASPSGGGAISKNEDGTRCAVTGKESLRIMRVSDGSQLRTGHKSSVGRGGHRIDASRNLWDGSGLKIDSASTDVAWGRGAFNSKILTSARNGELIMWDLNKAGTSKYERRSKGHLRSINAMSVSHIVHNYCITGSADGDMRIWDLRDTSQSRLQVHHPTSVRSIVFSPSTWQPLQAVVGLDNGSIYRWDLKMGQRGKLDRLVVAHAASVTTLDWCNRSFANTTGQSAASNADGVGNSLGWLVSGGLDRRVKVWDLTSPGANTRIPARPKYTLNPSFPVRRVAWRPSYECELAIASNEDFSSGSNPDFGHNSVALGGTHSAKNSDKSSVERKISLGGDPVEIWDVRRAWIPKWSVAGSAGEGGVSDLVFADSDAIWTQSSSGTFAQIDLRNCTKPLDQISRTAVTWEASGSMTFIADSDLTGQIPYDDMPQDHRLLAEKQHVKLKAIGDPTYIPLTQDVGTLCNGCDVSDVEAFSRLARSYVCHGEDRPAICAFNARVALQARKDHLAQAWLLLGASLTEAVPSSHSSLPSRTKRPSGRDNQSLPDPSSAPVTHALSAKRRSSSQLRRTSPSHASVLAPRSSSASRKITPVSSNASSPRQVSNALPSITSRRPSVFSARETGDSDLSRKSSVSLYRRPSASAHGSHSLSPADKSGSLRHVGEGALDDSDSSSESDSDIVADTANGESSEEESNLQPLISPGLFPSKANPAPSPLSQVVGQYHSTEDESEERDDDGDGDESSSPSPQSTDTDSPAPVLTPRRKSSKSALRSLRKHPSRMQSRSRSSTVASLAAPAPTHPLARHDSHSSIRTVTAGEVAFSGYEGEAEMKPRESSQDERAAHERHQPMSTSEVAPDPTPSAADEDRAIDSNQLTDRRIEIVTMDEKRFHDVAWTALRNALEHFSEEGDIQMCAMLSIIAPNELGIPKRRATRFIESYIDLLTRRRLYVCSAYLRKYCEIEIVRAMTLLETTLHSICGRCRKPIMAVNGPSSSTGKPLKGGYSYCASCKTTCATCAICRLPVRALLLQCAACSHGGHQTCYREYYSRYPPLEMPGSSLSRTTPAHLDLGPVRKRSSSGSTDEDLSSTVSTLASTAENSTETSSPKRIGWGRVAGYPCAAGCGHICWATNIHPEDT